MYLITTAVLCSAAFEEIIRDIRQDGTSVHDLAPEQMIGVLKELVQRGMTELAMELVDRSTGSPKYQGTITAIKTETPLGRHRGVSELIADFAVGSPFDGLDLDEVASGGETLLMVAVSKRKRPNFFSLPLSFVFRSFETFFRVVILVVLVVVHLRLNLLLILLILLFVLVVLLLILLILLVLVVVVALLLVVVLVVVLLVGANRA